MWIKGDGDIVINLDHVLYASWSGTGGGARLYLSTSTSVPVTFGTTEAEVNAALSRLVGAVDPADYVI